MGRLSMAFWSMVVEMAASSVCISGVSSVTFDGVGDRADLQLGRDGGQAADGDDDEFSRRSRSRRR
jgi:hypothetical protein